MAELADALDLGSSEETHAGSIPVSRTNNRYLKYLFFLFLCKLAYKFCLTMTNWHTSIEKV